MPCVHFVLNGQPGVLTFGDTYQAGDPPPTTYCAWHEWADVQAKAGLKQQTCGRCGLWKFPQELSAVIDVSHPFNSRGDVLTVHSPVCHGCEQSSK